MNLAVYMKYAKTIYWLFKKVTMLLAPAWALAVVVICVAGISMPDGKAEVAAIFGNALDRDGTPAPILAQRLDVAIQCYRAGMCGRLFVTGSIDAPLGDETVAMKQYLTARGVPGTAIIADNAGDNTLASARHLAAYMHEQHLASVMLISQYYHLPRARLAVERVGANALTIFGAYPHKFRALDLYSSWREVPAYAVYKIRLTLNPSAEPVTIRPILLLLSLFR
ncbi:YdcF family protein [Burkholderia ubonensis]|uniref:YdcF family protein n=1 Tax=Burkholderia ubonensis TaxID=101571 RepID=UPI001E5AA309|nr:YdcF family protein [Burkholderia ubonensis]